MTKDKFINICFVVDSQYVMPLCVTITSIMYNKSYDTKYKIYIIANNISNYEIKKINELATESIKIYIIDGTKICKKYVNVAIRNHVSTSALLKFNIADILSDIDKVLYLDSDIVVLKDLTEFYNSYISEVYACVIEDCLELIRKYLPRNGFIKEYNIDPYFNSGVMLLNLKKLREDNIGTKLVESKLKNSKWPYMDQSQFNYLFKGKCNFKNKTFNFLNALFEYPSEQYLHLIKKDDGNKYSDIYELIKDIVILHMAGNKKPWKYKENVPMSGTWLKYYKLSPYKNVPLIFKIEDTSTESKRLEFYKKYQTKYYNLKLFNLISLFKMKKYSNKTNSIKKEFCILSIPILKIIKKDKKKYIKLFNFIPLLKIKTNVYD